MIVEHRNVPAALRRLAVPDALSLVADQLLGIADTIVIGSLGTASLAGISAASSVFLTIGIGLFAFGAGPRIMGAQAIGSGDAVRFGKIVRASLVVPLSIALAFALFSLIAAAPLMHAMLGSIPSRDAAARYLMLRSFSLLPMMISGGLIVAFGAAGETRMALRALLVINAVHLPLLFVLALGFGTHTPFGITGAGISSLAAECVGLAYCVWQTLRRPAYQIFSDMTIDFKLVRATTLLALPEFVFLVLMIAPEPITIALLAPFGAVSVAAFRALTVVSDLTWSIPGSLGDAAQIVIGQRIGAKDLEGARWFRVGATRAAVLICGFVATIGSILAWPLAALVTLNTGLATVAAAPLALHLMTLPLKGYAMTALAPIRAAGDTQFSMWVGIGMSAIVIGLLVLGISVLHFGLWAVPVAWLIGWSVRSLLTRARLRGGDWEVRRLAA